MPLLIPVQSATKVVDSLPLEFLEQFPGKYRIKRNKRGNATRAYLRERNLPTVHLSNRGTHFRQELPSGCVYALRGVRGSEAK